MKKDKGQVYYTVTLPDGRKVNHIASIKDVYMFSKERDDALFDKIKLQQLMIDELMRDNQMTRFFVYILMICCLMGPVIYHLTRGFIEK